MAKQHGAPRRVSTRVPFVSRKGLQSAAGLLRVFHVCSRLLMMAGAVSSLGSGEEQHSRSALGLPCIAPLVRSVEETPEPIETTVRGNIPAWINGSLLRNGPGKFEFGKESFRHWFDGMALLHQFKMEGGQVSYKSHFLRSDSYKSNSENNRIMVSEFGTLAMPDPCKNFFQRFLSYFELPKPTDNGNINFAKYKGDYYVTTETNLMHRVDPETLESMGKVDWSKFIAANAATAHPHYDPDGTTYNMGNSYTFKGAFYNIIRVPAGKAGPSETLEGAKVLCSIPSLDRAKPSYYHSFAMSQNYVVFIEQPMKMDLLKIFMSRLRRKPIKDGIYWDPSLETVFHVISKHTGKPVSVKYYTKAMLNFHQINAFEQDDFLLLDLCGSDDVVPIDTYLIQNLQKSGEALDQLCKSSYKAFPRRFVFPLNVDANTPSGQNLNTIPSSLATAVRVAEDKVYCTHEELHSEDLHEYGGLEFPRINYDKFNTRPYRYFYGCGFKHLMADSLLKMDLQGKRLKAWHHPGLFPSEPVFVPSPDATEEDDGVILSVVVTPTQEKSTFLLVLDAKTFEELGRAEVPVNIPFGSHGVFNSNK
ncbi:carotenoid-cleaving dioxygenase, mitochondrial-like isoform X2 [Anguilla rostrata]|uniref:carotenoid-cleaving dioxygenase, mitochondrial-like isoform X2 n=1 Tax=Anguilla rostrata TaxID=7938 RepID=UPI0030CC6EC1